LKNMPSRYDSTWANPCAEDKDNDNVHNNIPIAKIMITPEIRCKIDAMAAAGHLIVVRIVVYSMFTGRCFFTIVPKSSFEPSTFFIVTTFLINAATPLGS